MPWRAAPSVRELKMTRDWRPAAWVLVGLAIADIVLAKVTGWMTVSQFCFVLGERWWWVPWAVGAGFIFLWVHLFWRWKNVWKWIKTK